MFVLINRKHLSYFAKSICIKLPKSIFHWLVESICIILQKVFVSNCKKDLYWFVESVCIILQNVFVLVCEKYFYKLQKVLYFFSKSICISLQKVFPLFQRSQLHVVQCRLSRSSLWKNFGIKRLLVRHFDSQFPPELWYKNFLNISHWLQLWILDIIQREVRM